MHIFVILKNFVKIPNLDDHKKLLWIYDIIFLISTNNKFVLNFKT